MMHLYLRMAGPLMLKKPVLLLPSSITRSTRITERFHSVIFFPLFALILLVFCVKKRPLFVMFMVYAYYRRIGIMVAKSPGRMRAGGLCGRPVRLMPLAANTTTQKTGLDDGAIYNLRLTVAVCFRTFL